MRDVKPLLVLGGMLHSAQFCGWCSSFEHFHASKWQCTGTAVNTVGMMHLYQMNDQRSSPVQGLYISGWFRLAPRKAGIGYICLGSFWWSVTELCDLTGEIPWSRRWFSQGEAYPLHSGCADPCDFPKCGKLDCIICGSGGLRSCSPLLKKKKRRRRKKKRP